MSSLIHAIEENTQKDAWNTLDKARQISTRIQEKARNEINAFLEERGFNLKALCVVCVGSVARQEAMDASDLDLIPVLKEETNLDYFRDSLDTPLRDRLRQSLNLKISEGKDLTACTSIQHLTDPECVGGKLDTSAELTKRILILTEGCSIGGEYPFNEVTEELLSVYSGYQWTSGRHVLSLCNDICRYYRTLFIEYKCKVHDSPQDGHSQETEADKTHLRFWPVRNLKLRHSRKIWFLSSMLTIATQSLKHPKGDQDFLTALLQGLSLPPIQRMFAALDKKHHSSAAQVINRFAWFLEAISETSSRKLLESIPYENRNKFLIDGQVNPFKALKLNSDLMHRDIMDLIDHLEPQLRRKILDWFFM